MLKKVLLLHIVLVVATSAVCFSQTANLDKKITIFANGEKTASFLGRVEKLAGFTFTYSSSTVNTQANVWISVDNKPIRDVLRQALGDSYVFTEIGNQVVITKAQVTQPKKDTRSSWKTRLETDYIIRPPDTTVITIYDTSYQTITDTSFVQITDTLKVHDTVVVKKILKVPASKRFKMNVSVAFTPYMLSSTKLVAKYGDASYKSLVANAEENYRGNLVGVFLDYPAGLFSLKTGVASMNLHKDISYYFQTEYYDSTETFTDTVKYWRYNTVLTYYKFKDGDTVKVPIIDSSQVQAAFSHGKVRKQITREHSTNTIRYVQLPLSIGYPIRISKRNWITPVVSLRLYFLYYANGYVFDKESQGLQKLSRDNLKSFMLSGGASIQYAFRLHDYSMIYIEPCFNRFVTNVYKRRAVNETLTQFYVFVGIRTSIYER